jgi:hypothetical protein
MPLAIVSLMIGLPEYRNGGLLVDLGLLTLTDKAKSEAISENEGIYKFSPSSQTVIEWRAITVIALYVLSLFSLNISHIPSYSNEGIVLKRRGPDIQGQDRRWPKDQTRIQLHPTPSPRKRNLEMRSTHSSREEDERWTSNRN